jgi:hypothetical protein
MRINVLMINTEIWALRLRLLYEYDFFDKFLIVEAGTTFSGLRKPFYTQVYRDEIPDPRGKIQYVYLDTLPWEPEREYLSHEGVKVVGNRWPAEVASRNAATQPLIRMVRDARDTIVVQDVDEIANLEAIEQAEAELDLLGVHRLAYVDYRGSVSAEDRRSDVWTGGYVIRAAMLGHDLHDLRRVLRRRDGAIIYWHVVGPHICANLDGTPMYPQWELPRFYQFARHADLPERPLGWHLTNMTGGFDDLLTNKINSYAHAENDMWATWGMRPPDETGDLWGAAKAFMEAADYSGFVPDPRLSDWIASHLDEFPILKRPD